MKNTDLKSERDRNLKFTTVIGKHVYVHDYTDLRRDTESEDERIQN